MVILEISLYAAIKISIAGITIISLLVNLLFYVTQSASFINFTTNLSTKPKTTIIQANAFPMIVYYVPYGILLSEYEECWYFVLCFSNLNLFCVKRPSKGIVNFLAGFIFILIGMYILHISNTQLGNFLCLITIQICCFFFSKHPYWVPTILIILANDIHQNPGPSQNYFTFMNWNCNSIAKDDFHRLKLLEVQNSLFNYDIISLCETSLNDQVKMPDPSEYLNNEYSFIQANKPDNTRHGGVGLFYKNSLPLKERKDLSFSESIVVELKYGRKKIFFTVLYRSPASNHTSAEFVNFVSNFKDLYSKIRQEKPYMTFFTGDFNAQSQIWYPNGASTPEGNEIENLISSLGLYQLTNEATNFEPNKNPTCIDLIITDQPNLVMDSGTRSSPDIFCHHQIIYCKTNFNLPPPPPFEREIWYYHRANRDLLKRCMSNFPWEQHLNLNRNPDWQAKEFTNILLNIVSNFIPHEVKKILPRDNPWITKPLKTMIKRKNRLYKSYKNHGYRQDDKIRLDNFRIECQKAIEDAKNNYLVNLGNKLHHQHTSGKIYWKILNKVMNKSKAPKVPPLIVDNTFIVDCKEKVQLFTKFFCKQCTPIFTNSVLPPFAYKTDKRIQQIPISINDIIPLISKLNPNKTRQLVLMAYLLKCCFCLVSQLHYP